MILRDDAYARCPEDYRDELRAFIEEGAMPGTFLAAVVTNNLRAATNHARWADCIGDLSPLVTWLYNEAPAQCYGSAENVRAWLSDAGQAYRENHRELKGEG